MPQARQYEPVNIITVITSAQHRAAQDIANEFDAMVKDGEIVLVGGTYNVRPGPNIPSHPQGDPT